MKTKMMIVLLMICSVINAQDLTYNATVKNDRDNLVHAAESGFIFYVGDQVFNVHEEINKIDIDNIRRHKLGVDIAKRIYLLEKTYTYMSDVLPGSFSGKRIVQKPSIYNSILKLEKHITGQVRKGAISREKAISEFSEYLDIALMVFYEDTVEFEEELKKAGSNQALSAVFGSVEFL